MEKSIIDNKTMIEILPKVTSSTVKLKQGNKVIKEGNSNSEGKMDKIRISLMLQ